MSPFQGFGSLSVPSMLNFCLYLKFGLRPGIVQQKNQKQKEQI